jgi:hypothetical protein
MKIKIISIFSFLLHLKKKLPPPNERMNKSRRLDKEPCANTEATTCRTNRQMKKAK